MRTAKTDLVFGVSLFLAGLLFHLTQKFSLLRDQMVLLLFLPSFFFVFPLCQAFLQGIAAGHEQIRQTANGSPWKAFRRTLWRRVVLWLGLWIVYFIAVEVYAYLVLGGGSGFVSSDNAGLALGLVGACFVWAPRCSKLWTLSLLATLTVLVAYFLLFALGAFVLDALGHGGYMGLGLLFGTPFVVLGCFVVLSVALGFASWFRGDAWFRLRRDGSSLDADTVRRSKEQGIVHLLIGGVTVLSLPPALNYLLESTVFSPSIAWVRQGELAAWPLATLDRLFLATPYWTTYHPGWLLGFLPGLPLIVAAWGLLKQRPWGRQLAVAFHGHVGLIATCIVIWSVLCCVTLQHAPNNPAHDTLVFGMGAGVISFGVALIAGGFLWWLCRAPADETSIVGQWKPVGTLLLCCVGLTGLSVAMEVAYNRISVYRGEATFQGKSTGDWLVLLSARNAETRHAATQELGKSNESVPVLREMYRGRPRREGDKRSMDGVHRAFWSRAFSALSYEANQKDLPQPRIGQPLLQALAELATDEDPEIRCGVLRATASMFADTPETAAAALTALRDEDPEVRKLAATVFVRMSEARQMDALPQLRDLAEDQQLPAETRKFASATITRIDPQIRVPQLMRQLKTKHAKRRAQAVWSLGCLREHAVSAVPAVTVLLSDPDRTVRLNAASAIGMFGPAAAESVEELIHAFEEGDPVLREKIAFALGEIGPAAKPAIPALVDALTSQNAELRVSAAEALWKIDRRKNLAAPVLRNAMSGRSEVLRKRASAVLETINAEAHSESQE